ncbi:hypothetical protein PW52_09420 [Tamlana sedimentorum]|uniref:Uncharacterized protein n=2 Tax=Neotamlana sedimentorum TaxID=1435349 RepID=A0A0D7W9W2_9FLAO|nr:hypothetical protein PW52_09420 [Tamlana sedimentorum]
MTLRKESLPFDWLLTSPLLALDYVYANIKDDFKFFLRDLKRNKEGKVFAGKYPESTFYHYNDLITATPLKNKIKKRCDQLIKLYYNKPICFLFVIPIVSLNSAQNVKEYSVSIEHFLTLLKQTDELLIYIRFENSLNENKVFYSMLIEEISTFKKLTTATLLLESNQFGLWGNVREYSKLLNDLGIKRKQIFPKIDIKKPKKT